MKTPPRIPGALRNGFRSPRLASNPQNPAFTALQSGDVAQAEQLYRKALEQNPADLDAHLNLGTALQSLGKQAEAAAQFEAALALDPNNADTRLKLGNTLAAQGKLIEAGLQYEQSLALQPGNAHAHMNLGNVLQSLSRPSDAILCYDRAIQCDPKLADIYLNYGNALHSQANRSQAKEMYQKALVLQPKFATAHMNLGRVLEEEKQLDEAITSYHRALALQPNYPAAHMNLGNALQAQGKPLEAIVHYERALTFRPNYAEVHTNLGGALQSLGRLDEAIASHDRALALKPDYALAHMNRALALLLSGNFHEGWLAHEWRWRVNSFTSPNRNFPQPQWLGEQSGEALHGKRILLHAEQGLGDTIQFLRYVPLVHAAGGTILLELPHTLLRLAANLPYIAELIAFGDPLPPFDLHCPLMSLPLAFGTELATIPAEVPYLTVPNSEKDAARAAAINLSWPSSGLRVGLVWAGNPTHAKDRFRSIPFSAFAPLLDLEGVHLFSLQMGPAAEQLVPYADRIPTLTFPGADLADTAARISHLDLVISVDTAIAHLTGALGIPVWLLLSTEVDWRWLIHHDDSPWYPTARLFRQAELGCWDDVLERVASELIKLIHARQR
jgi:tetratricopeptide (TPR) repeat protein